VNATLALVCRITRQATGTDRPRYASASCTTRIPPHSIVVSSTKYSRPSGNSASAVRGRTAYNRSGQILGFVSQRLKRRTVLCANCARPAT
jgi:hypothetical protein